MDPGIRGIQQGQTAPFVPLCWSESVPPQLYLPTGVSFAHCVKHTTLLLCIDTRPRVASAQQLLLQHSGAGVAHVHACSGAPQLLALTCSDGWDPAQVVIKAVFNTAQVWTQV